MRIVVNVKWTKAERANHLQNFEDDIVMIDGPERRALRWK